MCLELENAAGFRKDLGGVGRSVVAHHLTRLDSLAIEPDQSPAQEDADRYTLLPIAAMLSHTLLKRASHLYAKHREICASSASSVKGAKVIQVLRNHSRQTLLRQTGIGRLCMRRDVWVGGSHLNLQPPHTPLSAEQPAETENPSCLVYGDGVAIEGEI